MMKRSMKDTQAKRMLGMVMSTEGAALHKAAFTGWREFVVEEKQQKAIDKVRQEMKNKKNGNNKQLLGMLMGSQQSVVLRGSFSVWREHAEDARRAHIKYEMLRIRDKNFETKRRTCAALMGSQGTLMLKAAFSAWQEQVAKLKQEKALGEMKAGMKAQNTKRMLTMLMGSQKEVICKAAFSGWKEAVVESKAEKNLADMQHAMKDASTKKMMGLLLNSQNETIQKIAFSNWRELTVEAKREAEIDQFVNAMGAKNETTSKRMLAMLMHSQGETMAKAVFSGWHDWVRDLQQQRVASQSRELQSNLKRKKEEGCKRMLQMLLGSQSQLLLKGTFTAWRDIRVSTVKSTELEQLRVMHLQIKMKVSARSKTLITKMFTSQLSLVMMNIFVNWHNMMKDLKRENELVRLREMNMVNELKTKTCAKKAFAALAGTKSDILLKTVYAAWRESFREVQVDTQVQKLKEENMRMMLAVCEQETDIARMREQTHEIEQKHEGQNAKLLAEVLLARTKGQQASRGFLTKFFGAQGCILMKGAFTAWRELQIQTIAQKERSELARLRQLHGSLKDRKNQSSEKLVSKMLGSQSQGMLKMIISAWRELFSEFRTDVEHAQLKEENLRMMLAVCEQESEMTRLKEEVCRLMEENLESAKECRRLREESLHYAQQCRHLITSGGGEPTMLPRVAALTHLLSTAHEPQGEGFEVHSPGDRSRSPSGRPAPGPLAHLLAQVDSRRDVGGHSPMRGRGKPAW